jgi:hypothetical protein
MVTVLFVEQNSNYNKLLSGRKKICDTWDQKANALNYTGSAACIHHPPCRLWSRLKGLSSADENEKYLALWSVRKVQLNGGILEHPADSSLFKTCNLPMPGSSDEFGFTISIDQYHFGHKARKRTWLYIVGIKQTDSILNYKTIPGSPKYWLGHNNRPGRKQPMPQKEHSTTPIRFAKYLVKICAKINNLKDQGLRV